MQSCGIILSLYNYKKNKVALIDATNGRIDGYYMHSQRLRPGMIVRYEIQRLNQRIFLSNISLEQVPLMLAQEHLLFLHHVLEVSCQIMPAGSCAVGVFDLFTLLYSPDPFLYSVQKQKVFLFKLFTLLGIHSSFYVLSSATANFLDNFSINTSHHETIDFQIEQELDTWLFQCIIEHIKPDSLKTVHFLIKSRVA